MERRRARPADVPAPYQHRRRQDLILRDLLALDRTVLANERTLMAYVRTSLALLVAGVTLVHFFDIVTARVLGYTLIPFAPVILSWGVWRFVTVRRHLERAGNGAGDATKNESS